ncbi:hypothetical protein ACFYX8_09790 [Streptomyces cyaneofuscatus]|uniref:hypothetical protein n=1 Tax=Streptomyces TaxID=1883 RepID=UPI001319F7D4|nr:MULTISPECIES: hypothetical protein [unclassified Streptomyces]MZF55320.1 hypothetical protein [Streptomyces sp. SID5594]
MSVNRKTRRAGAVALTTGVVGALLLAVPTTAAAGPVPITPVEKYELYLSNLANAGEPDAAALLGDFQKFSEEKKEDFVGYVNDPKVTEAFLEVLSEGVAEPETPEEEESFVTEVRKELHGGDVVIESEYRVEDVAGPSGFAAKGTAGSKRVSHSVSDTIFGKKVTKVTVGVNYQTSTTRTTKVHSAWAGQSNFVPGVSFSNSAVKKWISANPGNNAHAETVWTGKIAGTYTWSSRHRVWADQDGFKGGYLKRI